MSSLAANSPAPNAPNGGCESTEPAPKDGSATSNAATEWTDPASKATKASRSGPGGRSSPTTATRSPSEPGETLPTLLDQEQPIHCDPAAQDHSAAVSFLKGLWRVGERRLDRAARAGPTGLVSSRRHLEPCMRFSRTRLSDVLHRRHSAHFPRQALWGLGATTVPERLISPRRSGEP